MFKAHGRLYHSTLGSRVIKKKKKEREVDDGVGRLVWVHAHLRAIMLTYVDKYKSHGWQYSELVCLTATCINTNH